jgi:hypothetical protein
VNNLNYTPTTLGVQSWREITSGGTGTKKRWVPLFWSKIAAQGMYKGNPMQYKLLQLTEKVAYRFRPVRDREESHRMWHVYKANYVAVGYIFVLVFCSLCQSTFYNSSWSPVFFNLKCFRPVSGINYHNVLSFTANTLFWTHENIV